MPVVSERPKIILVPENPLESKKIPYLEKLLSVADSYTFLDVVRMQGRSIGVPTNSSATSSDVRQYAVDDIRNHYYKLVFAQPQS